MIVFSHFQRLFGDTSPLFAQKRGAALRADSIRHYGITPNVTGTTPDQLYGIIQIQPPHDRAKLYGWLEFIQAEAVSLEPSDLDTLISDRMVRATMQSKWNAIGPDLDKLPPEQLFDALESSAVKAFNQPTGPQYFGELTPQKAAQLRDMNEKSILGQMKQAGIKDPLADWEARDADFARQAREHEISADKDYHAFTGHEPEATEAPLTMREQVEKARRDAAQQNYQGAE